MHGELLHNVYPDNTIFLIHPGSNNITQKKEGVFTEAKKSIYAVYCVKTSVAVVKK